MTQATFQIGFLVCLSFLLPTPVFNQVPLRGGRLVIAQRSEPKTLNPLFAMDASTREVTDRMSADLIRVDRQTQTAKPYLAESWQVSKDRLHYTIHLRRGLRFSDGQPFDADDVLFSFQLYLDDNLHTLQHDLFVLDGQPIKIAKLDPLTVRFDFPKPYAPAERMFDSVAILPRHLLEQPYRAGTLKQTWNLSTRPDAIAGLGPFRLKQYLPGEKLILERNPYYWKASQPYLDEIDFLAVGDEDAQIARYLTGETDLLNRVSARNAALLRSRGVKVQDLGPSLDYNFLLFNMTAKAREGPADWFLLQPFRQAISVAIDRAAMVRLAFGGLATPLASHVSSGNTQWADHKLSPIPCSSETAKRLLKSAGFTVDSSGSLHDAKGRPVEFTIMSSSSSKERGTLATMIQDDLSKIGIRTHIVSLESRQVNDRVLNTFQYDTAVLGLTGDPDPSGEMNLWLSTGPMHLWNPSEKAPATSWEAEIDKLMLAQASEMNPAARRKLFDRVQEIEVSQFPIISLVSPHVLVVARERLKNLRPVIVDHYTLWNADELYVSGGPHKASEKANAHEKANERPGLTAR